MTHKITTDQYMPTVEQKIVTLELNEEQFTEFDKLVRELGDAEILHQSSSHEEPVKEGS